MLWSLLVAAAVADPLAAVDWDAVRAESTSLLSTYLQLDTVNPPGNESLGAEFLGRVLEQEDIPYTVHEFAPGRGSLIARIAGGDAPPLCLLSHIDVATAEPERWEPGRGPLSGAVDDQGRIWGRGALDMKGLGIAELETLLLVKRQGWSLDRDLILIAVADEEVDNQGMQLMVDEHWDSLGCGHVINEGGLGVRDLLFEGQTAYAISVGEKGVLWLRMTATGSPGHGSTPRPGEAPDILLDALERLRAYEPEPRVHESLWELLGNAAVGASGLERFVLTHLGLTSGLVTKSLMADPLVRAGITDTIHITGLEGANEPNVVPSQVSALLDCRLLPGTTADAHLALIASLVDDERVTFEVISSQAASVSEWHGDPVYEALERRVVQGQEGVVSGPVISPGYTDSIVVRPLGTRAYGLAPFAVTVEEAATMHGDGEYLSQDNLVQGVQVLLGVVADVARVP